jgi:hypothetical protein
MKISTLSLDHIEEAVSIAISLGIEDMIIERDMIRSMDHNQSVILMQSRELPDFEFESLGLTRLNLFLSRLNMTKGRDNFSATATVNGDVVTQIAMKSTGVKIDYRASNPAQLRAPKAVRDTMANIVAYDEHHLTTLSQAVRAMGQNKDSSVTLVRTAEGVFFELNDENNDSFQLEFDYCEQLTESAPAFFAHRYPLTNLINLLKRGDGKMKIGGEKGILNIPMGKFDSYLLPVQ